MSQLYLKDSIRKFDVNTSNSKLEYYEDLLKKFKEWNSIKREIKLTNVLEGKKVQFDIEDITNSGSLWGLMIDSVGLPESKDISIEDVCFDIKSMTFILNGNNVEKLTIGIVPLRTEKGKILKSLIESDIDLEISEMIFDDSILYFYVCIPKKAA